VQARSDNRSVQAWRPRTIGQRLRAVPESAFDQGTCAGTRGAANCRTKQGLPEHERRVEGATARAFSRDAESARLLLVPCAVHMVWPTLTAFVYKRRPRVKEKQDAIEKLRNKIIHTQERASETVYKSGQGIKPNQRASNSKISKELENMSEEMDRLQKKERARLVATIPHHSNLFWAWPPLLSGYVRATRLLCALHAAPPVVLT
jgi:hypothetical protein